MKKNKTINLILIISFLIIVVIVVTGCSLKEGKKGIRYIGYGADKTVSGSMHIIEINDHKILLDAGSFYGNEVQAENRYDKTLIQSLSQIIISHAHIDHVGNLMNIVNMGYMGKIYCSEPTAQLLPVMLQMSSRYGDFGKEIFYSSKLNESKKNVAVHIFNDCKFGSKISNKNRATLEISRNILVEKDFYICRECAKTEIDNVMKKIIIVPLNKKFTLTSNIDIGFYNTPHLPGSVMTTLHDKNSDKTILYTGDVGSGTSPFLPEQQYIDKADYIITEATYGVKQFESSINDRLNFQKKIADYIKAGKRVIIPAFVLDRSQQVLYELTEAKESNIIPQETPIKIIGNSVLEINKIYKDVFTVDKSSPFFSNGFKVNGPFKPNFTELKSVQNKDDIKYGEIAIVSSGMANVSTSKELVKEWISDPNTVFVFVGYQDPETTGGELTATEKIDRINIDGVEKEIKAESVKVDCFTGHANINQISNIISKANGVKEILLVHINEEDVNAVKSEYEKRFPNIKFYVPGYKEEYKFSK